MNGESNKTTQQNRRKKVLLRTSTNPSRKRKSSSEILQSQRPKRAKNQTVRYGRRLSATNRDAFFEKYTSSNTESDDTNDREYTPPVISDSIPVDESSSSSSEAGVSKRAQQNPCPLGQTLSVSNRGASFEHISSNTDSDDANILNEINDASKSTSLNSHSHLINLDDESSTISDDVVSVRSDSVDSASKNNVESNLNEIVLLKLNEIIERISNIEKTTAKMEIRLKYLEQLVGRTATDSVGRDEEDFAQLGLPIKSLQSLDKLESDLNLEAYRQKLLNALKKIGGSSGRANGAKVIRSVVNKLIFTELMAKVSWTGKGGVGKAAKIRFQTYNNIIQLISDVCIAADCSLTEQGVINDLKYKVIKYAYTHLQTPSPSTSSSPPLEHVSTETVPSNELERVQAQQVFQHLPSYPSQQQQYITHQTQQVQQNNMYSDYYIPNNYYSYQFPNQF